MLINRFIRSGVRAVHKYFSNRKIEQVMEELSDKIGPEQYVKNPLEQALLKNYVELTQESYLQHLLESQKKAQETYMTIDPRLVLMVLPTLENEKVIKEHLQMLYPHLNTLETKQIHLFFQYLLTYKPKSKPKIPSARNLNGYESLLVMLGEIYPKDFLIDWLHQVPLYNGNNLYLLSMGFFSIVSGLSGHVLSKNYQVLSRCDSRLRQLFAGEDNVGRVGTIILGLEARHRLAYLQLKEIDQLKLGLLLVQLDSYVRDKYSEVKSIGSQFQEEEQDYQIDLGLQIKPKAKKQTNWIYNPSKLSQIKYNLQKYQLQVVKVLLSKPWEESLKLHTLVRFYQVLMGKKLEKLWRRFSERLINYTIKKEQLSVLRNLSTHQLLVILESMQSQKLNKPTLLKNILVLLSERLDVAEKQEMIRLARCLVTYVRQCEDYLIQFRGIVQRRKMIFSMEDVETLNKIFSRVQVLFPKPIHY